jgi:hypothetical protein
MTDSNLTTPPVDALPPFAEGPLVDDASLERSFDERREHQRFPFRGRAKAVVFPPTTGSDTTVHDSEVVTSDLSRGGVSILHRGPLKPGQQLMLMLNERSQIAEVRWCCQVWDGLFAAGCQFLNVSRTIDVEQQLLAIDVVISSEENWWQPSDADRP